MISIDSDAISALQSLERHELHLLHHDIGHAIEAIVRAVHLAELQHIFRLAASVRGSQRDRLDQLVHRNAIDIPEGDGHSLNRQHLNAPVLVPGIAWSLAVHLLPLVLGFLHAIILVRRCQVLLSPREQKDVHSCNASIRGFAGKAKPKGMKPHDKPFHAHFRVQAIQAVDKVKWDSDPELCPVLLISAG